MAFTQVQLRAKLLQELGEAITGTVTTEVDSTTVEDTALGYLGEHENTSKWLYIPSGDSGAIVRESRKISSFDTSTKRFTLSTAFSGAPEVADAFEISTWTHSEIERALNNAILKAGLRQTSSDSSLSWIGNTYSYDIPVAITAYDVYRVEIQGTPTTIYTALRMWRRLGDVLQFSGQYTAGKTLRLWYRYPFTAYTTEASSWDITDEEALLVCAWAAVELYRLLWQRTRKDTREDHAENIRMWLDIASDRQKQYTPAADTHVMRSWVA